MSFFTGAAAAGGAEVVGAVRNKNAGQQDGQTNIQQEAQAEAPVNQPVQNQQAQAPASDAAAQKSYADLLIENLPDPNAPQADLDHFTQEEFQNGADEFFRSRNNNGQDSAENVENAKAGQEIEGTGLELEKDFQEYPYNKQTVIKGYEESVDPKVLDFVREVQSGQNGNAKRVTVGQVNDKMSADIKRITGVDNKAGNEIILNDDRVAHITKDHGGNGKSDHSMANPEDIARIGYVLQEYDGCMPGDKTSRQFRNKDQSAGETIVFYKKINGTYFVVEAVPDTNKTWVVSAYMNKKGVPQVNDAKPRADVRNDTTATPGAPQVLDANTDPSPHVQNVLTPAPEMPQVPDAQRNAGSPKGNVQNESASISDFKVADGDGKVKEEFGGAEPGIKGTGAAEVNFAGTHEYDQLLSDENAQRDRKADVRPVEVPKQDANGRNVSEFVGNAYGSALTPDSFIPVIRNMVMDGQLSHEVQSNEQSLRVAADEIVRIWQQRVKKASQSFAACGEMGSESILRLPFYMSICCRLSEKRVI